MYYKNEEQAFTVGKFVTYGYGYYSFELGNEELLVFEEIKRSVLEKYNLKSKEFEGKYFEIEYSILTDDTDIEDFVVLRLNDVTMVSKSMSNSQEETLEV
jgi:hypothetical protein